MALNIQEQCGTVDEMIDRVFLLTWGKTPDPSERNSVYEFLEIRLEEPGQSPELIRLEDLCHVLLNSNPFLYKE